MKRGGASRTIPAGIVDAGCASLATFAVGLLATRLLTPAELGVYAVFFSALLVAAIVPTQLVFYPAEIASLPEERRLRGAILGRSLRLGTLPALAAAVLASGAAAIGATGATPAVTTAFATTLAVTAFVSPVQDHTRRLLHISGRPWGAAGVSIVQLLSVLIALVILAGAGAPRAWVPFGALAAANVCSLALAIYLLRAGLGDHQRAQARSQHRPGFRQLLESGRWLLVIGLAPTGALFAGSVIIARVAAPEVLGYAEAARIVAQPLYVLAQGLQGALGPGLLEAGAQRRGDDSNRVTIPFVGILLGGGLAYVLLVGTAWPFNPMLHAVPAAYVIPGLVAVSVAANVANGIVFPMRLELMGGRREKDIAGVEVTGSVLQCAVAATAGLLGAFARPLGLLTQSSFQWVGLRSVRRRHYARSP